MFRYIKQDKNIDTSFKDYSKDKTLSIENGQESFSTSIFGNGFAIEEVFSDILKDYDTDGDKILSKTEMLSFQKAIINAAGEDEILEKKELNKLLTKSEKTTELSEKNTALFKALIVALKNRPENFKIQTLADNEKTISSINDDGSGVKVQFFKANNEDAYRIEFFSNNGKPKEVITSTNCDIREGKNFESTDKNITTHIIYNNEGNVLEQYCLYRGDKHRNPFSEFSTFEYNKNGNLIKKYDVHNDLKTKNKTKEITTYSEDGQALEKSISYLTDEMNKNELIKYGDDGETIISKRVQNEKADIILVEEYDGANMINRLNYLPTKSFVYDKQSGLLKSSVINEFDKDGILIKKIVTDNKNNTTKEYDYSSVNGVVENASQGGIGNCFLLTTLNTLKTNPAGQEILNNTISKYTSTDENGNTHLFYKVKFDGIPKVIEDLNQGIRKFPKEKIYIQPEYTITEEELKEAALKAGKDYSSGDKDILLQEIAYAKHRKNVAKTIRENNEQYSVIDYSNALIAGLDVARSWGADIESMGDGGLLGLTMYLYTGKKSDAYFSKSQEHPVCFIDSNGNLSAIENSSSSWNTNLIKEESNVFDKRYDNIDKVIKILKKNTQQDGTFKNYIAEVSLPITNQAIKGQKVIGENHAFTIKAIKDDKVILINPWDSTKEVQISLADFMNSAQMINMLKL